MEDQCTRRQLSRPVSLVSDHKWITQY